MCYPLLMIELELKLVHTKTSHSMFYCSNFSRRAFTLQLLEFPRWVLYCIVHYLILANQNPAHIAPLLLQIDNR